LVAEHGTEYKGKQDFQGDSHFSGYFYDECADILNFGRSTQFHNHLADSDI
jgi:hypothetical protein